MVRAGAFADADIAISWHPGSFWEVAPPVALANTRADFVFTGRTAHAAAAPHLGRSALDAVELMSVGVNYMREHMPSDARVHYAYLDAGGIAHRLTFAGERTGERFTASDTIYGGFTNQRRKRRQSAATAEYRGAGGPAAEEASRTMRHRPVSLQRRIGRRGRIQTKPATM